jgi:allantoate deiminase
VAADSARAVLERAERLAACSEEPGRITRRYGTPALASASGVVAGWMRGAGMEVRRDAVGNVIGRYEAGEQGAPALLLGSHIDTVRDAGRYDGVLGVLVAIAVVERLRAAGRRPRVPLEVVAFVDEEGARFGTVFLGSSVLAGRFDRAELGRVDADGVSLEQAIRDFRGDPAGLGEAARSPDSLAGYAEVHIEQGPLLEERGLPLGVVSAISGQTRVALSLTGVAGHAGTVPMELRRDALAAAAEPVLAAERLARETADLVATVGRLAVEPGAPNVIPRAVELTLDVRHPDDAERRTAVTRLRESAEQAAAARAVELAWEALHDQDAVRCDPRLTELMTGAVAASGTKPLSLPSGAGHDAAVIAAIAPVTMLFVRCAGGVSHHPDEWVAESDVELAVDALARFVEDLAP